MTIKRLPKTTLYNGDVLDVLKKMKDNTYSGVVSDPPYGLSFMGKKWDYDVPSVEVFSELLRVTKKGGMILCFGGSRTFHRMACNMEDAGWILRDTVMWIYGSGFPKSHNISKAIEKSKDIKSNNTGYVPNDKNNVFGSKFGGGKQVKKHLPQTEESRLWNGYGTGLKPSFEPIIVAMKPMDKSFADNALNEGVSGLNLGECRVGEEEITISTWDQGASFFDKAGTTHKLDYTNKKSKGRWPANIMHDGSEEVINLFPTISKKNASRFFYCAKPSAKEKNKGCESLDSKRTIGGGGIHNQEAGRIYGSVKTAHNNFHPTVKPIKLMSYLVRLCKMPLGTKLLDPYMGSGTTVVASIIQGIDCDGIERDPKYIKIAQKRIKQARKDFLLQKSDK
ncbi:MAG: DNA-methyltransferase [Vampirovibrionia bacterium]